MCDSHSPLQPERENADEDLDGHLADLLNWWEPKSDLSGILGFNWTVQQLRGAVTVFLAARIHSLSCRTSTMLAGDEYYGVRKLVSANPHTPADVLDYLAELGGDDILVRIAENPSTPRRTLDRLAANPNREVRLSVAENSSASFTTMLKLATDENPDVRYRIAETASSPVSLLQMLVADDNPYVAERARRTLARLPRAGGSASAPAGGAESGTESECNIVSLKEFMQELRCAYSLNCSERIAQGA